MMLKTRLWVVLVTVGMVMGMASMAGAVYYGPVITETFDDAGDVPAGGNSYEIADVFFNNIPSNPVGIPGVWHGSGHVPTLNNVQYPGNIDNNWAPLVSNVQKTSSVGGSGRSATYWADPYGPTADNSVGIMNLDGIIEFTQPDHTPRPAVTGEKISGSLLVYKHIGSNFGFGFVDSISDFQADNAAIPAWAYRGSGGATPSPLMQPTGWTDLHETAGGYVSVPFSDSVTGEIMMGNGNNAVWTHAVTDIAENGGLGNGFVDLYNQAGGVLAKTGIGNGTDKPSNAANEIYFELTVGSSTYDVLKFRAADMVWHDIVQAASGVPNPGGAMPVGKVMTSIEGMFITGAGRQPARVWYDNINVEITPEPATMSVLAFGGLLMLVRRRRRA